MSKRTTNKAISRKGERTSRSDSYRAYLLIGVCASLLIAGFFLAGRQHFSSMDYGMKNSRLRKQIDDLQAEKKRLIYTREVALSPNEIKRSAKKVGLTGVEGPTTAPAKAELASMTKQPGPVEKERSVVVTKTALVTPVQTATKAVLKKVDKPGEKLKATTLAE